MLMIEIPFGTIEEREQGLEQIIDTASSEYVPDDAEYLAIVRTGNPRNDPLGIGMKMLERNQEYVVCSRRIPAMFILDGRHHTESLAWIRERKNCDIDPECVRAVTHKVPIDR